MREGETKCEWVEICREEKETGAELSLTRRDERKMREGDREQEREKLGLGRLGLE